jgi:hypothetical protein
MLLTVPDERHNDSSETFNSILMLDITIKNSQQHNRHIITSLWALYRSYFKGISANIGQQVCSVSC